MLWNWWLISPKIQDLFFSPYFFTPHSNHSPFFFFYPTCLLYPFTNHYPPFANNLLFIFNPPPRFNPRPPDAYTTDARSPWTCTWECFWPRCSTRPRQISWTPSSHPHGTWRLSAPMPRQNSGTVNAMAIRKELMMSRCEALFLVQRL